MSSEHTFGQAGETGPAADAGPVDDGDVTLQQGGATTASGGGATASGATSDADEDREVGVRAAVERGPAELSDEGDPVPDLPHISLEDREPARSTDEL